MESEEIDEIDYYHRGRRNQLDRYMFNYTFNNKIVVVALLKARYRAEFIKGQSIEINWDLQLLTWMLILLALRMILDVLFQLSAQKDDDHIWVERWGEMEREPGYCDNYNDEDRDET